MTYMTRYLILPLFFLQACAFIDYREVPTFLVATIWGQEELTVDDEFIKNMEYSFIRVKIGDSYAIMTLLSSDDGIFEWISSDQARIYTYKGRVIRTSGLTFNSKILNISEQDHIIWDDERIIKLSNPNAVLTQTIHQAESTADGTIEIVESFITKKFRWKGINTYLINKKNGLPIRTIQAIHPEYKKLEINYYYKY